MTSRSHHQKIPCLPQIAERWEVFDIGRLRVAQPGLAINMYSNAPANLVLKAATDVLEIFARESESVPLYIYEPDEGNEFRLFDASRKIELTRSLNAIENLDEEDGFGVAIYSTDDGQAQNYGFQLGVISPSDENLKDVTIATSGREASLLRVEFPWDIINTKGTEAVHDLFVEIANAFPLSSGIAGYSMIYTIGYTTAARKHVQNLVKRFHGFDTGYTSMQLVMADSVPSPNWLTFLGDKFISLLDGEEKLMSTLGGNVVSRINPHCVMLRSARQPPIGDLNRGAKDVGLLPDVARILKGIQFSEPDYTGLNNRDDGLAWLSRFDAMAATKWDNSFL